MGVTSVTRFKVDPKYAKLPGIEFIRQFLKSVDLSRLDEFKITQSKSRRAAYSQVYGNMKYPRRGQQVRISVMALGEDSDFPIPGARYPRGKYGGGPRPEAIYDTLDKQIVCTAMHEMYHYLAFTKQIKGDPTNEREAIRFGFALTDAYERTM